MVDNLDASKLRLLLWLDLVWSNLNINALLGLGCDIPLSDVLILWLILQRILLNLITSLLRLRRDLLSWMLIYLRI